MSAKQQRIDESDGDSEIDDEDEEDENIGTIQSQILKNKKGEKEEGEEVEEDADDDDEDDEDDDADDDTDDDDDEPTEETGILNRMSSLVGLNQNSDIPNLDENNAEDDDDDDDEEDDENYLQKFDENLQKNVINTYHPEMQSHNSDEIESMTYVVRDETGTIIDPLHQTLPFVTRYEKARIIGERAKQINAGATPFIEVSPDVIDGYLIALNEFERKKIPFIVQRPLPNGGSEYWKLKDLEILA